MALGCGGDDKPAPGACTSPSDCTEAGARCVNGFCVPGGDAGGPSDAGPPPASAAVLELSFVQVKLFRFTWTDVEGATFYRLLEDPDGSTGYTQVGADIPQGTGAMDHEVSLHRRLNARYRLQSCNRGGCRDSAPVEVIGTLDESIGYFKASNTGMDDLFGGAVALSADGTTLAVGAYREHSAATGVDGNESDNSLSNAGAVYVFRRSSAGTWAQEVYLKASNTDPWDWFGFSVALSADGAALAVGAQFEDSVTTGIGGDDSDNSARDAGAVYVFRRSAAGVWAQEAYLKASNTGVEDLFGVAVSLSSDGATLAVGALSERSAATGVGGDDSDNSVGDAGAVYLY